jgi:hypothetical protein
MTRSGWYFARHSPKAVNMPWYSQYIYLICSSYGNILTHVCTLQSKTGFKNTDQLVKVPVAFVLFNEIGKLFGVNDEIETANLGKAELLLGHASLVDLSPHLNEVSNGHM